MNDNNTPFAPILLLIVIAFGVSLSFAQGFSVGESQAQKETISYCIEQPSACKTKYDYYKLENKK